MKIGVLGGGAWGTALAQVAAQGGAPVILWAREPEVVTDQRGIDPRGEVLIGLVQVPEPFEERPLARGVPQRADLVGDRAALEHPRRA